MKKTKVIFYFILITLTVSCSKSDDEVSSPPYEGNVVLSSQEEVDEFGAKNHSGINGDISISGMESEGTPITSLSSLKSLTYINGSLSIEYNNYLTTLKGLNNVKEITWFLNITSNDKLENLDGLGSLSSVDAIEIHYNISLTQIDGLRNLTKLGYLYLYNIPITNIDLKNLTLMEDIKIWSCNNLATLDGLSNLTSVGGKLDIVGNDNLINLNGFNNIKAVNEYISIRDNENLLDFCGLNYLFQNNSSFDDFFLENNAFNPTVEDMKNGNCK